MEEIKCRNCGCTDYREEPHEIHGAGLYCTDCGRFIKWKGKGGKKNKRKHNKDHRDRWKELGPLTCHWCGITETETQMHFEIDHIMPLVDGGEDVFENTRPLCAACHWSRNAELHRSKYIRKLKADREALNEYLERFEEPPF